MIEMKLSNTMYNEFKIFFVSIDLDNMDTSEMLLCSSHAVSHVS